MSTTNSSAAPQLPQLHIDTSCQSPTTTRVIVVGEIDLATVSLFRDRLLSLLHDQAPAVVDIDLAGVSFLDCTGIGALVAVRNIAVQAGRKMRIVHPRPFISRVLELSGMLDVLTAPIEQPAQPPPEFHYPAGTRPAAATMTQPPDLIPAA